MSHESQLSRVNSSTEIPRAALKIQHASGLRQELVQPPQVEDPVEVLQRIVGQPVPLSDEDSLHNRKKPLVLVDEISFEGLSLVDFVTQGHEYQSQEDEVSAPDAVQSAAECE